MHTSKQGLRRKWLGEQGIIRPQQFFSNKIIPRISGYEQYAQLRALCYKRIGNRSSTLPTNTNVRYQEVDIGPSLLELGYGSLLSIGLQDVIFPFRPENESKHLSHDRTVVDQKNRGHGVAPPFLSSLARNAKGFNTHSCITFDPAF